MLERAIFLPNPVLLEFSRRLLEAAGVPERKAHLVASSLVAASLRGVDSRLGNPSVPIPATLGAVMDAVERRFAGAGGSR